MRKAATAVVLSGIVAGIACWPVTTRVGVNYVVTAQRLTLTEKAVHFLSRHWQTQRLAASIVGSAEGFEEKIKRILAWVQEHVQPVPEGLPVVDDHPLYIILRGYGSADQRTEAFALIASYSGLPAAVVFMRAQGGNRPILLALVRRGKFLYPLDVEHNILFRSPNGDLADLEELTEHPEWIQEAAGGRLVDGIPYVAYLEGLRTSEPSFMRMELQRPWSRFQAETQKAFRLGSDRKE